MTPSMNQTMMAPNATILQIEARVELLQWVWGPFNFDRLVIISLILQFILFFGAPFRKSTANGMLLTLIWSSYLLADWVSYYSIGLVLNGETGLETHPLHILWGSLLLAHISGPDTISVLDMEDHQLWSRTALQFGTIAYSIARVTIKMFNHKIHHRSPNRLMYVSSNNISHEQIHMLLFVPTIVLLMVGIIKSLEKIATLFINQTNVFQDHVMRKLDLNPRNVAIVGGAVRVKVEKNSTIFDKRGKLSEFGTLRVGYELFKVFKGCYVDFMFVFEGEGLSIKKYFLDLSGEDAFKLIEAELNLMYDVFYTKASSFHKPTVRFVRYLTIIAEVVAFGCLASGQLVHISNWIDVSITYILVLGVLFMDIVSTLQIIFSIRTIFPANGDGDYDFSFRGWILEKILSLRRRTWGKYSCRKKISYLQLLRRTLFKRWSESMAQFNFVDYCMRRQPRKLQRVYTFLGVNEKINKATHVSYVWLTDSLRDFIFEELKSKALGADQGSDINELYDKWVVGQELDKWLLIWHIATEFCQTDAEEGGKESKEYEQWSKTLSNYLLCLVIQRPKMLKQPELGLMGKIRLETVCEEAGSILWNQRLKKRDQARRRLVDKAKEDVKRGNESDGVMCKAVELAEELKKKGADEMWKVISKVWVKLMCNIAAESKPSSHIRTLNKGGELLSLVWLMMNHLGMENWKNAPVADYLANLSSQDSHDFIEISDFHS